MLRISRIRETKENGRHRVGVRADIPVWFESSEVRLRPSPEAFGSALLLPALGLRKRLRMEEAVSPVWYANVGKLLEVFHEWWRLPQWTPEAELAEEVKGERAAGTALCFSGGVDSFYTLLRGGRKVDWLVSLHGFDIPLRDGERMKLLESSVREAAAEVGARGVVVRTNLRQHWGFRALSWEWTHGGMLAALGHLMSDYAGELLISSSWDTPNTRPWGSHARTDPLWSSERVSVVHCGAEIRRNRKLHAISGEPIVQRHLRVCWENRTPQGNCSRCEKCVRTRLILLDHGKLEEFKTLEGEASLVRHIDELPSSTIPVGPYYRGLVETGNLSREVKEALWRLLFRTEKRQHQRWRHPTKHIRRLGAWLLRFR
jgi:hypothetical protein